MYCCSVFRLKVMVPTSEARRQLLGWCFAEADVRRTTIRRILGQIKPTFMKSFWGVKILVIERLKAQKLEAQSRRVLVAPFGKIQWGFTTQPFFKWARERERKCKICVPSFRCVTRSSKLTQKMRQLLISSTSFWFNTIGLFAALMKILPHSSQQWLVGSIARRKRSRFSPCIPGFESRSRHSRFFWQWPIERCVREENWLWANGARIPQFKPAMTKWKLQEPSKLSCSRVCYFTSVPCLVSQSLVALIFCCCWYLLPKTLCHCRRLCY